MRALIHKTIKKVTDDIENLKFNTAIAALMTLVNELLRQRLHPGRLCATLLLLLNPFAPHITEELWETLGFAAESGKMCCQAAAGPVYDASKTVAATVDMAVQVNGKLKGTITMPTDSEREGRGGRCPGRWRRCQKATEGMKIVKTILVKHRSVNLIVKPQ